MGRKLRKDFKKDDEFKEQLISVKRVSKTVKGGRIFKFSVIVVVGNKKGKIGMGTGKASEIPDATRKATEQAKKNIKHIALRGTTIPHDIIGEFGAGRVLLKPAPEGTGVIAGGPVRAVAELLGVKDIRTKSLRSNNSVNVVRATMDGLLKLRSLATVAKMRGKPVGEILK